MKQYSKIVRILLFITLAVNLPLLIQAQTYSEKREQGKSFKLKSGTVIQITNKYGNVNVIPWEKDSVRIEVSMSAQSKQAAKVVKTSFTYILLNCSIISSHDK